MIQTVAQSQIVVKPLGSHLLQSYRVVIAPHLGCSVNPRYPSTLLSNPESSGSSEVGLSTVKLLEQESNPLSTGRLLSFRAGVSQGA